MNEAAKIVLTKARYKIGDSTRKLSLTYFSKPNIRVVKSCSKCLKLEAPEMAKKPLLSLPINAKLVSNL